MPLYTVKITRSETATLSFFLSAVNDTDAKKNALVMLRTLSRKKPLMWTKGPPSLEAEIVNKILGPDTKIFLEKQKQKGFNQRRRMNKESKA